MDYINSFIDNSGVICFYTLSIIALAAILTGLCSVICEEIEQKTDVTFLTVVIYDAVSFLTATFLIIAKFFIFVLFIAWVAFIIKVFA